MWTLHAGMRMMIWKESLELCLVECGMRGRLIMSSAVNLYQKTNKQTNKAKQRQKSPHAFLCMISNLQGNSWDLAVVLLHQYIPCAHVGLVGLALPTSFNRCWKFQSHQRLNKIFRVFYPLYIWVISKKKTVVHYCVLKLNASLDNHHALVIIACAAFAQHTSDKRFLENSFTDFSHMLVKNLDFVHSWEAFEISNICCSISNKKKSAANLKWCIE